MGERSNWAGSHEFAAASIVTPGSIGELQALLRGSGPVRALGTRHSFTDLADTSGTLVSTVGVPADPSIDERARTVTVGAGTRYGALAAWLGERGWALHNLGSLPHISIGGAIATGTHGSGNGNGALSTAVSGLEFVDHRGDLARVTRGDPRFDGLVVGLGAFGIVVRVTLDIQPAFRMRQDVYTGILWDDFLADPDVVTDAAYSVSVFTRWTGPELDQVWLKSRLGADEDTVPPAPFDGRRLGAPMDFFGVEGISERFTTQGGVPGSWEERLPHFRFDVIPSFGDELQTEYFVPRADARASLSAVRALAHLIDPLLFVTELRTVAADTQWLSGASARDSLAIHFTWRKDPAAVLDLLPEIESALRPFDARPHWGKVHLFTAEDIARVHPRLDDARTLFSELDPDRRFSNAHLERLGVR